MGVGGRWSPGGVSYRSAIRDPVERWVALSRCAGFCLLVAGVVGGCGSQTIVKTVIYTGGSSTPVSTANPGGATSAASSGSSGQSQPAAVGDTLTLQGDSGERMAVTVDGVMDPLAVGPDDQADSGQRFVGVQITLKNVGSVPYSDSPSNGATLLSNQNEQAQGEIVSGGPCGNGFQSSANVASGDTQQGCIPFEMPNGETPASFQFTLSSGFADQTGQWSLAGATTGASTAPTDATSTSSEPARTAATGPLATLSSYWSAISAHKFGRAYGLLAAGATGLSESQFVSGEQQAGITSAEFRGTVASDSGSSATVGVDSLVTHDSQFGCRSWSGSYELVNQAGSWLIQKATITPGSCR